MKMVCTKFLVIKLNISFDMSKGIFMDLTESFINEEKVIELILFLLKNHQNIIDLLGYKSG